MVFLSYAICVCDEVREIRLLLTFLNEVRDRDTTEIVILIDSKRSTEELAKCLKEFDDTITAYTRDFDGDYSEHKNFLNSKCNGKYIFNIDADEIPQESLVKYAENLKDDVDVIVVPRINICPGYSSAFIKRWNFTLNNAGWINWPDYQGRIYRNDPEVKWVGKVHEKISAKTVAVFTKEPDASVALWHVKDTIRQNKQNEYYLEIEKKAAQLARVEQLEKNSEIVVNEIDQDGSGK